MLTLENRVCAIAGASGGDGVAIAEELCKAGMTVVMVSHQPTQAMNLMERLNSCDYPGKCDVFTEGTYKDDTELYQKIYEKYGAIDVIISNIGDNGLVETIDDVDSEGLLRTINHLVIGAYDMLKNCLPYLRLSKAARVIFMTTIEGEDGGTREGFSQAVAKGAVLSLTKNCAAQLAKDKITVNCIEKGASERINGERFDREGREKLDVSKWLDDIPMGRLGNTNDLAAAVCYLASEEASYVTGSVIKVTGGLQFK